LKLRPVGEEKWERLGLWWLLLLEEEEVVVVEVVEAVVVVGLDEVEMGVSVRPLEALLAPQFLGRCDRKLPDVEAEADADVAGESGLRWEFAFVGGSGLDDCGWLLIDTARTLGSMSWMSVGKGGR
jgi:hypothetical protein